MLAVITGASRGYGRALSIEIAKKYKKVDIHIIGRTESDLLETKKLSEQFLDPGSHVVTHTFDLADLSTLDAHCSNLFSKIDGANYHTALLFNNAGTTGQLEKIRNYSDMPALQTTLNLGIASILWLSKYFLNTISEKCQSFIINISSGVANNPGPYFGQYSIAKAGMNMVANVLAVEEANVKVLTWEPGIFKSAMNEGFESSQSDIPMVRFLGYIIRENKVHSAQESVIDLLQVLEENSFKSGDLVRYLARHPDIEKEIFSSKPQE